MPETPEVEWRRLRADQLRELARQDAIVILPIASLEQHGPHLPVLTDVLIAQAYLARVRYDDKTSGVMLGLVTDDERNSEKVAGQMGKTFAALFNTKTHLDIMFLDDERDAEIRRACTPFYDRTMA